jgi:hypothetical protein
MRILHALPDAPAFDVYTGDSLFAANLSYEAFTDYLPVPDGSHDVAAYAAGYRMNAVASSAVDVSGQPVVTVAVTGNQSGGGLIAIPDPVQPIPAGMLMLRLAHLAPDAPSLSLEASGTTLFSGVGYRDVSDYAPLNPGAYTLRLRHAGSGSEILHAPDAALSPERFYTVYAVGSSGSRTAPPRMLILMDGNSYTNLNVAYVAVIGRDGRLLFGPARIRLDNITDPLSALALTGLPYTMSPRFPGVVESIAGQRNQGQAGWEYAINGQVSNLAASQKPLQPDDRLIWWYSPGHGTLAPTWERLGRSNVVHVAVVGRDGRLLFGPADIALDRNNNPLSALAATGLPSTLSPRFPGVVESIAGQRNQGQAGWEYAINGQVSNLAASQKPLHPGDRLIWWYSPHHGAKAPTWESLG